MSAVVALTNGGCSAANSATGAAEGCSALSGNLSAADESVLQFSLAATDLKTAADNLRMQWLTVCNDMNRSLNLDATQTTAEAACAVLQNYITTDVQQKGVTVSATFTADCEASVSAQASCQANCAASASCDVTANCTGGEVVVQCNGTCSGQCDVQDPTITCNGTCKGSCALSAAAMCTGECTGSCSATFNGSCGGNCNGTCNGTAQTSGSCAGTCVGSCDAQAKGSCGGMCSGSCTVAAGATCNGTCNGTCSYTPGAATCKGTCHGMCSVTTSPPECTGTLNCTGTAQCNADCQAQASASVSCSPPQAMISITGDTALAAAYAAHVDEIGQAVAMTQALFSKIGPLANTTANTFSAIGNVSVAGAACAVSAVNVAQEASVSIKVSFSVTGSVTTGTAA